MTDRIPLDHLTSDHLDQQYDQLDELREKAATRKRIARRRRQQLDQAEDLLSVAHETSNQSETERAVAVKRAERAEAAIVRVRDLHYQDGDHCAICTEDFGRLNAPWPCPTIRALGPAPDTTATQATEEQPS